MLTSWSRTHLLRCQFKESPGKRKLLVVKSQNKKQLGDPFIVTDNQISPLSSVRYLGVTLNNTLYIEAQIESSGRSAYYHFLLIKRARGFLYLPSTRLLVQSLVISRLHYYDSLLSVFSSIITY